MIRHLAGVAGLVGALASPMAAQDRTLVQTGREIYVASECDRCHMVGGKGYKDGKLDGVASKLSPDDMRKWLTDPKGMEAALDHTPKVKMSSRRNLRLTAEDVTALVAYLRTLR